MDRSLFICRLLYILTLCGSDSFSLPAAASRHTRELASAECYLDGKKYRIGDTWHPVVQPFGLMSCVNCSCFSDGKVRCVTSPCQSLACDKPRLIPGQCCPTCDELATVPPTAAPTLGRNNRRGYRGCRYQGKRYQHGVTFPSKKSAIRPTRPSQCVLCACMDSKVVCYLKSCPVLKCKEKVMPKSNECCPMCQEDLDLLLKPEYWERKQVINRGVAISPSQNDTDGDCINGGEIRQNGSAWHPYVAPFGTMRCIVCACVKSLISCRRVSCPTASALLCKRPRRLSGECCLSCSHSKRKGSKRGRKAGKRGKGRPGSKRNRGRGRNRNGKKGRRRNRGGSRVMGMINGTAELSTIDVMLKDLCLPLKSDRLIYTTRLPGAFFVTFDVYQRGLVNVIQWTVNKGRVSGMKTITMLTEQFRKDYKISKVIGATNKRNYRRFRHRLQKHTNKCRRRSRPCKLRSIEKILRRLRIRKVRYWKTCPQLPRPSS